jgi:hypothetical protein
MSAEAVGEPLADLAAKRLGGMVLAASDEFFAPKESLLEPAAPVYAADRYTDRGKWMDGWETRRRREPGNDWALVRLGLPGMVRAVRVDTTHFRGNHPAACSLAGVAADPDASVAGLLGNDAEWVELLPPYPLEPDADHRIAVEPALRVTHVRLWIFPDGGVARLRVLGEPMPDLRPGKIRLMGDRFERARRALTVTRVARRSGLLRVLRELGVVGRRPATQEGAREFRQALEELGTTFIKLGQLLSSRPDLLPDVYIEELGKLVDQVPPVPFDEIRRVIAEELPDDPFARLDEVPLATASIAQIHTALLKNGREVIVKIRRPGIKRQVEVDLALLRRTASLLERRSERAQLLQARALADELEVHLRGELDLTEEANNAELVARLLEDYEDLVVPQVIRPFVTERALVLERLEGRKVDDQHGLPSDRAEELARQLFKGYVHQVTVEGVYHADPHRGNVLLLEDGRLALVDFGLLGRLDDDTRRTLSLLLLAVAQNRADDVADLILGLSRTTLMSDEPGFLHDLRRKLPAVPLAAALRNPSRRGARRSAADLVRIRHQPADELRPRGKDPGAGRLDRARPLPEPRSDPADGGGRARGDAARGGAAPRAEPVLRVDVHAAGAGGAAPAAYRPAREQAGDGDLQGGGGAHGPRGDRARPPLGGEPDSGAVIVAALLVASALLARVHDLRWFAFAGFCAAFVLGVYIVWKIIRTPGEL